jgi:nucleoside-diphosphate-sugar epimerase
MHVPDPQRWLVFGASGSVGGCLLARLQEHAVAVDALSRSRRPSSRDVCWLQGSLEHAPELEARLTTPPAVIACCGPLDAFVAWLAAHPPAAGSCVVALSSLSADWKANSPQPAERALAARLQESEQRLFALCQTAGAVATVFRCGLLYGGGECRSLAPLLRLGGRLRVLPWPRAARGLREPVHVDDIAQAMLKVVRHRQFAQSLLRLPGPERITFHDMLRCSLAQLSPAAALLRLPTPGLRALSLRLAGRADRVGVVAATVLRLHQDQCAQGSDWHRLALQPRRFEPAEALTTVNSSTAQDRKSN